MVMEVETRLPPSGPPSRPLSEGPSYSPITPERGPTPEQQVDDGRATGAEPVGGGEDGLDSSHGSGTALLGEGSRTKYDGIPVQAAISVDATVAHPHTIAASAPGIAINKDQKLDSGQGAGLLLQQQFVQQSVQHALGEGMALVSGSFKPAAPLDYSMHAARSMDANLFPNGNPAFQTIDTQVLDDVDSGIPPLVDDSAFMESAASVQDSEPNRIRAFAKLEFDDGQFYMNTYAIEIGRDRDAARQAERKKIQEHDRKGSDGSRRDGSNPDLERAQKHADPALSAAASVISGGIMHMGAEERLKRKKKRSKSTGSSSKGAAGQREPSTAKGTTDYQALANASLLDRNHARPVDLTNMMPSPDECPLIPIHPPPTTEGGLTGHKGISRKHVRIAYNHEKGLFELHVLGKNGCFIDGAHMESGEVVALASGTDIQIGGVSMRFILPNVPDGETGTDLRSDAVSQSAMSFDFEDGRGESAAGDQEDSETPTTDNEDDRYRELREAQKAEALLSDDDEDDEEDDDDEDEEGEPEEAQVDVRKPRPKIMLKLSSKSKSKPVEEEPAPPKRKVGRPPKNGIMSKREEAEIRRKEKEMAKAKAKAKGKGKGKGKDKDRDRGSKKKKNSAEEPDEVQVKEEVDDLDEEPPSPTERRKSSKKKKPEEPPTKEPSDVVESIEKDQSETPADSAPQQPAPPAPKPKKERPAKPPRSPSPVFNEAELTAEQLAKPSQSYVVLIHEALSNHPDGRMSLPQIYRAIERKYPYYKLRVQTVGWQSSVRHNLSQHPAFKKIERDGKGWMWGLDPSVSIEREKKRRPSPPPMQAPGWSAPGSNTFNRTFPQAVYSGNSGQMPQNPYAMFPNGHPPPAGRGFPPPGSLPRPSFPGTQQQQPPSTPPMYQSPYGSNRPPGQSPAEGSQAQSQQPNQAVPQMPAPYLNQAQRPPNGTTEMSANSPAQPARPGPAQNPVPPTQRPAVPRPSPQINTQTPNHGPQAPSPQARPPTQASPAFSPPPPNNPYGIPQNIWVMIERFRGALKTTMGKVPDGEAMLNQAINKCIGLKEGYRTFEKESSIITPLKNMLLKFNWPVDGMIAYAEGRSATRPIFAPPAPSPSAAPAGPAATAQSPVSATSLTRPPSVPAHSPVGNVAAARAVQQVPPPPSASSRPNPPPPLPPQYKAPSPQQQQQQQRPAPPTTQSPTQSSISQTNAVQQNAGRQNAPSATSQPGQARIPGQPQQSGKTQASGSSGGQDSGVLPSTASTADMSTAMSAAPAPSSVPPASISTAPANQPVGGSSGTETTAAALDTPSSSVPPAVVSPNGGSASNSGTAAPANSSAAVTTSTNTPSSIPTQTKPASSTVPAAEESAPSRATPANTAPESTLKRPRSSDGAKSETETGESNESSSRVEGEPPAKKLAQ